MKPISFVSKGDIIAGNLFLAGTTPASWAFLFIQGWLGRQNVGGAQSLANLGFTSLTYDMRGNGDSEGDLAKLSKADFLGDAVIAYDFLRQQVGPTAKLGVVGSSFGSYTAILLTERRSVSCLSLRVPANYPDESFDRPDPLSMSARAKLYGAWRNQPLKVIQNKTLRALHKFSGDVQIVEAENDEQIPHQTTLNFVNAVAHKKRLAYEVMPGAPHSLVNERLQAEYVQLLSAWVRRIIAAT